MHVSFFFSLFLYVLGSFYSKIFILKQTILIIKKGRKITEYQCENEVFMLKWVVVKEVIYVVTFKGKKLCSFFKMLLGRHPTSIHNVFLIFDAWTPYISVIVFFIYNITTSKEQSSLSLNKLGPRLKTALYANIHKLCFY